MTTQIIHASEHRAREDAAVCVSVSVSKRGRKRDRI